MIYLSLVALLVVMGVCVLPMARAEEPKDTQRPVVALETSMGTITLELFPDEAPATVENFLRYVDDGFYNDTIFHRVIGPGDRFPRGFVIQGGGLTADMREKPTRAPIPNESDNGLKNERGTIAMARTADPDSATSQFFINLDDHDFLNAQPGRPGYTVFGRVIEGMDVVDAIGKAETSAQDVPNQPIVIQSARRPPGS